MKIDPVNILLNKDKALNKKFYFISGNEITLMKKIEDLIIEKLKREQNFEVLKIETFDNFVNQEALFGNQNLFLYRSNKSISQKKLNELKSESGVFVFICENSQKTKPFKNYFIKDKDSFLIDCYELDREAKIKVLNNFLKTNNIDIKDEIFWTLIEKLDSRYVFFENTINKIKAINDSDISIERIQKLISLNSFGKEKLFFYLLKKNNEIVSAYREKIISKNDVSELFYYCRFFCHLIIESETHNEYSKKIPMYLFREKKYLIYIYNKYNLRKKIQLLRLLSKTEKALRNQGDLSLMSGLRFLLSLRKITIS
tara:strand:- start:1685 stop:2623 length:939 start_codon:yes stop_codon:yes gene_type:complete